VGTLFTFASFDWLMSLTPEWFSTMYGVYVFGGAMLASIALFIILVRGFEARGEIGGVEPSHYYALGRCLLCFVIFWAYIGFFQFMLIWIANKPEEVTYYIPRLRGTWRVATFAIAAFEFAIPFIILLSYHLKRQGGRLAAVAGVVLAAHYFDVHWLVAPALHPDAWTVHWLDGGTLLFVGGATALFGIYRLRGLSLVPVGDARLAASLRYDSA
jgi:hypothetical protein